MLFQTFGLSIESLFFLAWTNSTMWTTSRIIDLLQLLAGPWTVVWTTISGVTDLLQLLKEKRNSAPPLQQVFLIIG